MMSYNPNHQQYLGDGAYCSVTQRDKKRREATAEKHSLDQINEANDTNYRRTVSIEVIMKGIYSG